MKRYLLTSVFTLLCLNLFAQDYSFNTMLDQSKALAALHSKYDTINPNKAIREDLAVLKSINAGFNENELDLIESLYTFLENPYSCKPVYDISAAVSIIEEEHSSLQDAIMKENVKLGSLTDGTSRTASFTISDSEINDSDFNDKELVRFDQDGLKDSKDVTDIVDATAQFLVDRVKQELIIEFYDVFRKELDKEYKLIKFKVPKEESTKSKGVAATKIKYVEKYAMVSLSQLFPKTSSLFNYQDIYTAPSNGKVWYTAYKTDLDNLPENFIKVILENKELKNQDFFKFIQLGNEIKILFEEDINAAQAHQFINNVLNKFPEFKEIALLYNVYKEWLVVAREESFDFDQYNGLTNNEKRYFSGLLFQKLIHQEDFKDLKENCEVEKVKKMIGAFTAYQISYKKLEEDLTALSAGVENTAVNRALLITKFANNVMTRLLEITASDSNNDQTQKLQKLFLKTNAVVTFTSSLKKKDPAQNLLELITLNETLEIFPKGSKFFKNLVFYSNFLVDIEEAADSTDVEQMNAVLQKYALPVGSYRMKRSAGFSIDINAYPGVIASYENVKDNKGGVSFGITAPIGIAFSFSHCYLDKETKKSGSSSSLFLSVVDIGAPFAYRFTNDSAEGLPAQIKWEQIFSPGIAYVHGFRNSPISIMAGAQYAPQLRKLSENATFQDNVLRFNVGITVDIPLFNLVLSNSHDDSDLFEDKAASDSSKM